VFVPTPKAFDGSPTGNSYVTQWLTCRRKWFARYLWPHDDGSVGLDMPRATIRLGPRGLLGGGANRMLGSLLHAYKEAWYKSGIRDGEDTGQYSHDAARAAMVDYLAMRVEEFETAEAVEWASANVNSWCEAFHRFYGPDGHTPLWPQEKVLCLDDGRPAVELEFGVPLGVADANGREYVYTCRYDGIALWQDRYLLVLEHKTAAPSWAERYVSRLPKSSQFTGEMFVLRYHPQLKDLPWDKIRVAYHLKGWSPKSSFPVPVVFGDTTRTPDQLERFRLRALVALEEIDVAVGKYRAGMERGDDPVVLRDVLFPETGEHTGECYSFNSVCDFEGPCRLGFGPGTLGGFRAARRPTDPPPLDADIEGE
jgi:hypothetical protein